MIMKPDDGDEKAQIIFVKNLWNSRQGRTLVDDILGGETSEAAIRYQIIRNPDGGDAPNPEMDGKMHPRS
jgi:hypothetical protein